MSAGVSYNKLLAKMSGGLHKPDNQTVLGPGAVERVINTDMRVTSIPGIGRKTGELLESAGILTVHQLRRASSDDLLKSGMTPAAAEVLQGLVLGVDKSEVKMSGRVGSIGLEDRFRGVHDKTGVRDKLSWLIDKLEQLIIEDGRQATTFRVTVRDYFKDKTIKKFHKESRQTQVSPRLFQLHQGSLRSSSKTQLIEIGVSLVAKMVNFSQEFHLTLLGVAVTDFLDQVESRSSITRFFSPTKQPLIRSSSTQSSRASSSTKPPVKKNISEFFNNNDTKKRKLRSDDDDDGNDDGDDVQHSSESSNKSSACPSKYDASVWDSLPEELKQEIISENENQDLLENIQTSNASDQGQCPPGVDSSVFQQLPEEIKKEILENNSQVRTSKHVVKKKKNNIMNYFAVKNSD